MRIIDRYRWFVVGASLLVILTGISSCNKSADTASNAEKTVDARAANQLMQYMAKPDQEKVALLAIKYGVSNEAVETLLDAYLSKTDQDYQSLKDEARGIKQPASNHNEPLFSLIKDKKLFAEALRNAAVQSAIPPETAASIVEEYKIWAAAESTSD